MDNNIRYEIHSFDSGCKMIDIWCQDKFYVVQLEPGLIGLSLVTDKTGFGTIPDTVYKEVEQFKVDFEKVVLLNKSSEGSSQP
jgi:hypothetical protein